MAQQTLDGPEVRSRLQVMRREAVTQRVHRVARFWIPQRKQAVLTAFWTAVGWSGLSRVAPGKR